MPDRSRRARNEPPSPWDHILSHPAEVAIALWWAALGGLLILSRMVDVEVSRAMDMLPLPLGLALAGAVGGGGLVTLAGIMWPGTHVTTAWAVERVGLILAIAGWLAYLTSLIIGGEPPIVTTVMVVIMIVAAGLRLVALHDMERDTRTAVETVGPLP